MKEKKEHREVLYVRIKEKNKHHLDSFCAKAGITQQQVVDTLLEQHKNEHKQKKS